MLRPRPLKEDLDVLAPPPDEEALVLEEATMEAAIVTKACEEARAPSESLCVTIRVSV